MQDHNFKYENESQKVVRTRQGNQAFNDTYLNHCLITFVYLIRDIFVNQKKAYTVVVEENIKGGKKSFVGYGEKT